ncbi:FadR/GntR family transcriptional regulator [Gordonia sp. p3-SID1431]|uniref:FadR/GntR family transcriptional regulator n=1 Tax=Gordonia sp. p3-SID1431 TaxID=2916159 RepID=UPI0021A5C9A2|nr:FCD domain-containing protein [Gordonia sp. p3-SID1431]MCT1351937.1 FCD domain-containing protein [Gordonia sp. p3-SID1431]
MSGPINPPQRTSELVVQRMQELIAAGTWPLGERIPTEPELVAQFGVGRNTIREAARALEHAGMLEPRRGDGTYVRGRSPLAGAIARTSAPSELRDLLEVRRALESEASAGAAARGDAADVERLRLLLACTEDAMADGDLDRYTEADIAFHAELVVASRNALLIAMYDGIAEAIARTHPSVLRRPLAEQSHPRGHRDVVDAIERGDADAARAAVYAYVDFTEVSG